MAISSTFLLLASLIGLLALCQACDPDTYKEPTIEYKMRDSDVVAAGTVIRKSPEREEPDGTRYDVTFRVFCIFKGSPVPEEITIYDVGFRRGLCFSTNLTQDTDYMVYLSRREDNTTFVPKFSQDPGGEQYLEEVVIMCETKMAYPDGVDGTRAQKKCPEPYEHKEECIKIPPVTSTVPTPPPNDKTPPPPPGEGQDGNAAYKPVVDEVDEGENSSTALTFNLVTLALIMLSAILL